MKSMGIVRKVDELGRIVLPRELRRSLDINIKDSLEIFTSNDKIVLKKYEPFDIFTGETDDLIEFNGKRVSRDTIKTLAKLAGFNLTEADSPVGSREQSEDFELEDID